MELKNIIGVVLAGGKSSRMGQDKALLDYNGRPLLDHMIELLEKCGLDNIYVSGNIKGYRCIPDRESHEGPGYAIYDVLQQLDSSDGVLFVPVDMPLLQAGALCLLMSEEGGGYFTNSPLPAFITKPCPQERSKSVKELLDVLDVNPIPLPPELEISMTNTNTPEEWDEVLSA